MGDKEVTVTPDLKKLGEIFNVPFERIMKAIEEDRELALSNYEILKNKIVVEADDSSAAKEQMNKAMELIINSTQKLTAVMNSAAKIWGDTVKAMAISQSGRNMSPQEIQMTNERRRLDMMNDESKPS